MNPIYAILCLLVLWSSCSCTSNYALRETKCLSAAVVRVTTQYSVIRLRNDCEHEILLNLNWEHRVKDTIIIKRPYRSNDSLGLDLSECAPVWTVGYPRWHQQVHIADGITFTEKLVTGDVLWLKVLKYPIGNSNYLVLITDKNLVTTLPLSIEYEK